MTKKAEAFLKAIDGREIWYSDNGKPKVNGYFYDTHDNPQGCDGRTWRHMELSWCYPDMDNLREDKRRELDRVETECRQYITELTPEEVLGAFAVYGCGKMPVPGVLGHETAMEAERRDGNPIYIDTDTLPDFPCGESVRCKNVLPGILPF